MLKEFVDRYYVFPPCGKVACGVIKRIWNKPGTIPIATYTARPLRKYARKKEFPSLMEAEDYLISFYTFKAYNPDKPFHWKPYTR